MKTETEEYDNYYTQYIGPPIKLSYIEFNNQKEDITSIIQTLYGENLNWNKKFYKAESLQIPNIIGKTLYIEFDNPNPHFPNHIDYMKCKIDSDEMIINRPLFLPCSKNI